MMDTEQESTPPGNPILLEEKHIVVVRLFFLSNDMQINAD